MRSNRLGHVERRPRVGRARAHVEEQRAVGLQHPRRRSYPGIGPLQVLGRGQGVLITVVADAQVIGRRGDDDVDTVSRQLTEYLHAIAEIEPAGAARWATDDAVRFEEHWHTPVFRSRPMCSLIEHPGSWTVAVKPHRREPGPT